MTDHAPDPLRIRRLLDSGRALVADLDPQAVLVRTLAVAREVTGARYGALGILDGERAELEQFLTLGIDDQTRDAAGVRSRLRGLLTTQIAGRVPQRLADAGGHPGADRSPAGDPQVYSFLGAPILIADTSWGALCLTEKQDGEFTQADEEAAVILAGWAGTAVENAHRYGASERRRIAYEQALGGAPPARDVTVGLGGETDLERVLDLIVKRGRTLIDTGHPQAGGAADDARELLDEFAASATKSVAMAQSAESNRLRSLMAAGDAERTRWARELHDETLQGLGAIRLLLAAARRRGDPTQTEVTVDEAIGHIEQEIDNLHAIISDLRPGALDELGLRPALEALLERRGADGGLTMTSTLILPDPQAAEPRLEPEIESTVYRVVQEALTNIVKHAEAQTVRVAVTASAGAVSIEVRDDGIGFAAGARSSGFGLVGMRERVRLAGGTVRIDSGPTGTHVRAALPAHARTPAGHSRPGRPPFE
ncbi:MAG TPA: GAF domain-containing sensor histidine kinase [Solirubrobacteraceae bacterium]